MRPLLFIEIAGVPVPESSWGAWSDWMRRANRCVACDVVGDVAVSTVFLGMDHSFYPGARALYETMVFRGEAGDDCMRYATRAEALEGHARIMARERTNP